MRTNAKRPSKLYENCFVCFFRPALLFGWTGITVLDFHCDHSVRPVKCFFKRSWPATFVSIVLSLMILFVAIHNGYTLLGTRIKTREDVLFLGAVMIDFSAAYLLSVGFRRAQIKINDLQGIAELARSAEEMGICFFNKSFVKAGRIVTYMLITMFVFLGMVTIIIFFVIDDFSLEAFKNLCTDMCVLMQGTLGVHYVILFQVKLHIFQRLQERIRHVTENRLKVTEGEDVDSVYSSGQCFEVEIRHICRLYSGVYQNFLEDDRFVGPAHLIWWNTVLTINVLNAYVMLNSIMIQQSLDLVSVSFMLKIYGCMLGVTINLFQMEAIAAVVSVMTHTDFVQISYYKKCLVQYVHVAFTLICTRIKIFISSCVCLVRIRLSY